MTSDCLGFRICVAVAAVAVATVLIWAIVAPAQSATPTYGVEVIPTPPPLPGPAPPVPPPGHKGPWPPTGPSPYKVQWIVRHYDIDVMLVQYHGSHEPAERDSKMLASKMRRQFGVGRVVAYPDSYVPIIVSKRRMAEVQKLLGDEMLPLTPDLEWNPHGQQGSYKLTDQGSCAGNRPPNTGR